MHVARILFLTLALVLAGCGGDDGAESPETAANTAIVPCNTVDPPAAKPDGGQEAPAGALDAGTTYALFVETNCGSFTIQLDLEKAPKTAASLVSLAESGFFDGTSFHRVVPGFVIQGGDPTGTGTGGPGYKTVDVPPQDAKYTLGVVAMAKSEIEPPGTAGSQFFVVTGPDVGLPPDYAVVGTVSAGMETVSQIDSLGAGDGPPSQPVVIEKITVKKS